MTGPAHAQALGKIANKRAGARRRSRFVATSESADNRIAHSGIGRFSLGGSLVILRIPI